MNKNKNALGIYIHWPFCLSKCPYCDFFSKVKKDVPQDEIIAEYLADIDFYAEMTKGRKVGSIFFGGGTPSLIAPANIEKIISHIAKKWSVLPKVEISLEANPNTQTPTLFRDLKQAGVNRLSLGVQALKDEDLQFLGRTHDLAAALSAIEQVTKTFDNHSMDLIYARPKQKLTDWVQELKQAVGFGFKHLSLYQLTIEEGTLFHKKGVETLEDDAAMLMYDFTDEYTQKHGYPQYEVSNYGLACQHNKLYWQGDDYVGVGQAAHGRLQMGGKFYATTHRCQLEELTAEERAQELVIMGLRLNEGIDKKQFKANCGLGFDEFINAHNLALLLEQNLVLNSASNIRVKSFDLLDKIIEDLCV